MVRLFTSIVFELLANAIGLLAAGAFLDGFSIDVVSFFVVIGIFTITKFILGPLVIKLALNYAPAFRGGIALVTTFIGLLITTLISDGLTIDGLDTWAIATFIVWLFGVIASLVLPLFIFKKGVETIKENKEE